MPTIWNSLNIERMQDWNKQFGGVWNRKISIASQLTQAPQWPMLSVFNMERRPSPSQCFPGTSSLPSGTQHIPTASSMYCVLGEPYPRTIQDPFMCLPYHISDGGRCPEQRKISTLTRLQVVFGLILSLPVPTVISRLLAND